MVRKVKVLFIFLDFTSGLIRNFLGFIPWFGIIKQSEHVNYLTPKSLENLIVNLDIKINWISGVDTGTSQGRMRLGRLSLVARKNSF
jgi:hypothetical protein